MTKHQRPEKVYDFAGFSARQPTAQVPGDRLAAQFANHAEAIVKLQQALEGLNAPITVDDLDPKLFRSIAQEARASLEKLALDSARAAGRAASAAQLAVNQAAEAKDAARPLLSRAEQLLAAERDALQILEQQRISLHLLEQTVEDLKARPTPLVRTDPVGLLGPNAGGKHSADALGAAATAADYAEVSIHWAEWMGPGGIYQGGPAGASDIIPDNILAINSISGDHWSSRWWAHKAAEYVNGFLYGYYMGPWPQAPIQAIGGGPIPVGSYYFNTSNNVMYVWTGTEWIPFNTPQKASAVSLWYRAGTGQTAFPLTVPDLFGQSIPGLDPAGTQPIEVHLRGELLLPTYGAVNGDYWVDVPNSTVEIGPPTPIPGSLVAIDVLIDPDTLAPGAVKVIKLRDFNFDGVRTTFSLIAIFNGQPVVAADASQLFVVVDGVDQEPGVDFTVGVNGDVIVFMEAPRADAKSFTMFFEAAGGPGGVIVHDNTLYGDGTAANPLGVTQQVLGAFNAQLSVASYVNATGLNDGELVPAAQAGLGKYVVVHVAGTPTSGPTETRVPAKVGDWWISDGSQWHLFPIGGGVELDFGTGLTKDETASPPIVHLDPAGPTNMGGVIVPVRDATTQALSIDMGDAALGDPATGELRAPPATEALLGAITEPIKDGLSYSRHWDAVTDPANPKWAWTPALTAGLQITSIIPDKAIYGPGEPLLTVHAYGSEFTATTVAVLDGQDTATSILSATELTFVLNPQVPISEQFHIITVRDPAAVPPDLAIGLGAEQFDFIKASTEVDYGRGLSLDTLPTPPMVNLDPAGPTNMGGVIVPLRDRTTNGLVIDMGNEALGDPATGHLTAPPATAELLGTVCVPARSPGQGLVLGDDGMLRAPLATDQHAGAITEPSEPNVPHGRVKDPVTGLYHWEEILGGFEEPPMEPVQTWGRSSGGARGWLPLPDGGVEAGVGLYKTEDPATLHLNIASRNDLGGVIIAPQPGLAIDQTGNLTLERASPTDLGGIVDAPYDDTQPTKSYARRWGEWVPTEPGGMDEPPADPVALWGRSSAGARGWMEVPSFDHIDGFVSKIGDTMTGPLNLRAATGEALVPTQPTHAINLNYADLNYLRDPPNDGVTYGRKHGIWEPMSGNVTVAADPPSDAAQGDLWWDTNTGKLYLYYDDLTSKQWVEITSDPGIEEAPKDGNIWGRMDGAWASVSHQLRNKVDKAGDWMSGALGLIAGDPTDPNHAASKAYVDRKAFDDAPLNGRPHARKDGLWTDAPFVETLDLIQERVRVDGDAMKGYLTLHDEPKDPRHAATKAYVDLRARSDAASIAVGDSPPSNPKENQLWFESDSGALFIWYADQDSRQWVEVGGSSAATGGGVTLADVAPASPAHGDLWVNSNTFDTSVWYVDQTSAQWVQTSPGAPPDLTGYATEAWVATQITNATIDAQGFTRAGANTAARAHSDETCEKALAAVEALTLTVKRLERRIKVLEGRK